MSLRDEIENLRDVARRLDAAKFDFNMSALEKFADTLDAKATSHKPDTDFLKKLSAKFLRGDYEFSRRELKNLPFIIYGNEITSEGVRKIFSLLDLTDERHLRGLVNVYLNNYDTSDKTEFLRRKLNYVAENSAVDYRRLKKNFAAREKLFGFSHSMNMTNFFAQRLSVDTVLEELGLTDFFKTSKFIQAALVKFFYADAATLDNRLKILRELDAEYDIYRNIFPAVTDALIQAVDRAGNISAKKFCLEIFYRRLGDPRFGLMRSNWDSVSQKSKEIFLRWLVEDDLEIFFKLIKQTAVDRMWRYREKFWRAYLPYISNTWIFLGSDAKRIARQLGDKNMGHGKLSGGTNDQSVFVFRIGQFIFSEWSHNGKLRVYPAESANYFFGLNSLSKWNISKNCLDEWIHHSPKTYSWQKTISEWLKTNCGVTKTQNDWGLED